jgi:hypothetical protein
MYIDRATSLDSLLGTGGPAAQQQPPAPPADDRDKLNAALAETALVQFRLAYLAVFMPAMRDAARKLLVFAISAAKACAIHEGFGTLTDQLPVPEMFRVTPSQVRELARAMVRCEMIDPHDSLLADVPDLNTEGG